MCKKATPFFSVIVPVYNNEADLEKCVWSILRQSCRDFELILVDDESTDRSPQICDDFAERDDRVRVVHKKRNGGAAAARNAGLFQASGKYVYHVDGDDWIAEELLEKAYYVLNGDAASDIFVFCYVRVQENGQYETRRLKVKAGRYNKERLREEIYPSMICKVEKAIRGGIDSGSLCDKIIKRELLEKHYCRNEALFRGEDSVCAWECMYYADEIYFSDEAMYYYNRLSVSSGLKKYHSYLFENDKAIAAYLRMYLRAADDYQIEQQVNALEFRGAVRALHQEIDFHHSIRNSTLFFREKCKRKEVICTRRGMPLRDYPYIMLLNMHKFSFLLICVLVKKKVEKFFFREDEVGVLWNRKK